MTMYFNIMIGMILMSFDYACLLYLRTFYHKLLHNTQVFIEELNKLRIKYAVCSGHNAEESAMEKLVHVVGAGIALYPPLSSQMRGVKANTASQGIMLRGVSSNGMGTMHYYVRVKQVEYYSEDKVIEILWQSVRRGQCWEIRNNMDYFPNDLVHLGENVLGGKDVLNSLPDFNVDVRQKVREVCNNGLIVKLVFTSDTMNITPMLNGNSYWTLRSMGVWPTCSLELSGSDIIDDNHALNDDFAILGDGIFQFLSFYSSGRYPM
jgi:hypothetical protein